MMQIPIDINISPEFSVENVLGGLTDKFGLFGEVHEHPIGLRVRDIQRSLDAGEAAAMLGREDPTLKLFNRFELWLIPHTISVVRREGSYEPTAVGLEIRYKNGERTCSVRSLIPSFRCVENGHIRGSLEINGELGIPKTEIKLGQALTKEFLGLKFAANTGGSLSFGFDATVATPLIAAVGINGSRCEWRFDRDREPLFGRDIETWAVVALPKRQRELSYELRYYVEIRRFVATRRIESDWVPVECVLSAEDPSAAKD